MAAFMDQSVEKVVNALQRAAMWNDTVFIWSSDNGAAIEQVTGAKSAWPLRGGYYTNWEGGVRAPGLVNGGFLPASAAGSSASGLMHLADWMATFCRLAGCDTHDEAAAQVSSAADLSHHTAPSLACWDQHPCTIQAGLPGVDSMDMWDHIVGVNKTSPRQEVSA